MYSKCKLSFVYKTKGFFSSPDQLESALRKFFIQEGYMMEPITCGEEKTYMYMIEPVPEMPKEDVKSKKVTIVGKKS